MRNFLAFVGQVNTTFGAAHKRTGKHNVLGKLVSFSSKKERDDYCSIWDHTYNAYPVPTNKKEAKSKYFAGCTQEEFDDYLKEVIFL